MAKKSRPSMLNSLWQRRSEKKSRRVAKGVRRARTFESLESRNLLAVTTFIQGAQNYAGTQDTILVSLQPTVNFGEETGMSIDQQDGNGVRQGLLKFDNIFGAEQGQIPLGSTINSASLTFSVFNDSNAAMQMSFYRMNVGWDQVTATWNSFGSIGGVQASEGEAEGLPPDGILYDAATGTKSVSVTTSLQHWATGEINNGWLIETAATNGWDFNTSEATQANRPILTVNYTAPSGAGQFQFLNLIPSETEGDSGPTVAMLQINRIGGTSGAVTVDYTIAAGAANPATAGADFTAAGPITVNFADGQSVATIPVTITGDTTLEGLETIDVTLSNATGGATINGSADVATLTIGDDDALINEVVADISNNTTDETNREYIELIGTASASLAGYYFVVFEGNEAENGGAGTGIADLVIDLGTAGPGGIPLTFGSNGLLVITPTAWAYQGLKDAATAQLMTAKLDGVGGKIEDSSKTYALIKSPTAITEGTDYDTVGAYASAAQTAVSGTEMIPGTPDVIEGLGILDSGPFDPSLPANQRAQMVDSVGLVRGGGGDRDRVLTTREANHPAIHVHQPQAVGTSDLASDAVTRRIGQKTPNSIGVWFNGDIPNGGASPIAYAPQSTAAVSVVAPPGAVITPGAGNILRNFFLTVSALEVDESAGTVTLTVERSGDDSQAITVNYATVNGTAIAGQDYTAASGVLNFAIGDSSEEITIDINEADNIPEAFEDFGVTLTASPATSPFVISVASATVTINDGDGEIVEFQTGLNGYAGTRDTTLNSIQPNDQFGIASTVVVDEQAGSLRGPDARPSQGLLRFDDLFGNAENQVPSGAQILTGFLTLSVPNASAGNAQVRFYQMLQQWSEGTATWSDPQGVSGSAIVNGVTPDDIEASIKATRVTFPGTPGTIRVPVDRDLLQAWANGSAPNYGWSIVSDSGNDWIFSSAQAAQALRPKLTILYAPVTASAGTFGLSDNSFVVSEGGSTTLTVHRVGGSQGTATVDYTLTAGTGALTDIDGSPTGSVTFADGEISKTFTVAAMNDTELETNETLTITLSGGVALDPQKTSAMLTIRDGDFSPTSPAVLLNEIFINSPGNDGGQEFAELFGTPGAALGSLYFVTINGDVGEGEGSTDLVVDLGSFANGSGGATLIGTSGTFGFRVPSGTTYIGTSQLVLENLANDTATYALVYSPTTRLHVGSYDYDWDNDGSLELPVGAVIVDSVGNKDNGVSDQTYGPASNVINSQLHPNVFVADAISRFRNNTSRNSAAAWYRGDLTAISTTGDDMLVYDATNQFGVPFVGAALSPGELNTGSTTDNPLVSLTSITPSLGVGTVTLTFNGPISQFLDQGGSPGVRITNPAGNVVNGVNPLPTVTGLGTNTLTLSFTGSAVVGGQLPAGSFRLNFTGNSLIGNGRAVDTANTATAAGSNHTFDFTQVPTGGLAGDYDDNSFVDGADFLVWQRQLGSSAVPAGSEADGNSNGTVDAPDLETVKTSFGAPTLAASEAAGAASAAQNFAAALDAAFGDEGSSTGRGRGFRPGRRGTLVA